MNLDLVTNSDLLELKSELIEEIKKIVPLQTATPDEYLKSAEVRKLMKISAGTLLHLRVSGKLPFTKIGHIVYLTVRISGGSWVMVRLKMRLSNDYFWRRRMGSVNKNLEYLKDRIQADQRL